MRIIDADALKANCDIIVGDTNIGRRDYVMFYEIDSAPTIDAVEVVHGEWIDRSDGGRILNPWWETYECNKCGQYGTRIWNFCPNCGAKMDGECKGE